MLRIFTIMALSIYLAASPLENPQPSSVNKSQGNWWEHDVFYEIFVRSFFDSNADGVGDLQGIISKLDYLNDGNSQTDIDLGIKGIWLMPIMESPSYHGYDCIDYRKVDQEYGSNEIFRTFMAECHKRGIRVILDLMLNHSSSEHPWFLSSRESEGSAFRDWYIWSATNPGVQGPWGQPVWHPWGGQYFYGIFWSGMPDLNYSNPAVTEEFDAITRFWIEEMGADGLRLDAIRHLMESGNEMSDTDATHQWLKSYNQRIDVYAPSALTVGEIWSDTMDVVPYVKDNEVDLAFEFQLSDSIIYSINSNVPSQFKDTLSAVLESYPRNQFATFITNHDQNRAMTQFSNDTKKAKLAATLILTIPGTPFLYYGEEIGMTGAKPDELIRTPMQWSSASEAGFTQGQAWEQPNADYPQKNVEQQSADPDSLLSHYRKLIQLRNRMQSLRQGDLVFLKTSSPAVCAYLRIPESTKHAAPVLVILNFNYKDMDQVHIESDSPVLRKGLYTLRALLGAEGTQEIEVTENRFLPSIIPLSALAAKGSYIFELIPVLKFNPTQP